MIAVAPKANNQSATPKARTKRVRAEPGAPSTQDLYTGMSGQFFAMSQFLWRGYNVAIPAVDVGDDVFVIEETKEIGRGMLRRVQVKTAGSLERKNGKTIAQFGLSRGQLNVAPAYGELYFMLIIRWDEIDSRKDWRFILIRRDDLNTIRATPVARRRGPKLKPDGQAADQITMSVELSADDAYAWGHSLKAYLDQWSSDWPAGSPMRARIA